MTDKSVWLFLSQWPHENTDKECEINRPPAALWSLRAAGALMLHLSHPPLMTPLAKSRHALLSDAVAVSPRRAGKHQWKHQGRVQWIAACNDATKRWEGLCSFLELHPEGGGWGEGLVWLLTVPSSTTRRRQRVSAHGRTMAPAIWWNPIKKQNWNRNISETFIWRVKKNDRWWMRWWMSTLARGSKLNRLCAESNPTWNDKINGVFLGPKFSRCGVQDSSFGN